MHIENLVKMANNISFFFQADPDRNAAIHGCVDHIRKFWDPRMRTQIIAHNREGGEGLSDLAKESIRQLDQEAETAAAGK